MSPRLYVCTPVPLGPLSTSSAGNSTSRPFSQHCLRLFNCSTTNTTSCVRNNPFQTTNHHPLWPPLQDPSQLASANPPRAPHYRTCRGQCTLHLGKLRRLTFCRPVGPGFSRPKHKRTVTGLGPAEIKSVESSIPIGQRDAWKKHSTKPFANKDDFEKEAIRHIETTLARSLFNCDEAAAYQGSALAFRDRLIVNWNKTQQRQATADPKRLYCQ